MKRHLLPVSICCALLGHAMAAAATITIDTTPSWTATSSIGNVGAIGRYRAMGQTIQPPASHPVLNSFSLFVDGGGPTVPPMEFVGAVSEWNGTAAVGSTLFESAIVARDGPLAEFTFNTGALLLDPNKQYVLYVDTLVDTDSHGLVGLTSGIDSYAGGGFVGVTRMQNFADSWEIGPGGSDTNTWSQSDAAFRATFSEVPEPAALAAVAVAVPFLALRRNVRRR